jgi:hypothetical protein
MRYRWASGVLITMIILWLAGYVSAGHMGHGPYTIHIENAWARRTPPMAQQEHLITARSMSR